MINSLRKFLLEEFQTLFIATIGTLYFCVSEESFFRFIPGIGDDEVDLSTEQKNEKKWNDSSSMFLIKHFGWICSSFQDCFSLKELSLPIFIEYLSATYRGVNGGLHKATTWFFFSMNVLSIDWFVAVYFYGSWLIYSVNGLKIGIPSSTLSDSKLVTMQCFQIEMCCLLYQKNYI